MISISKMPQKDRLFNSRFINEIQHRTIVQAYEKSGLVVQSYNNCKKSDLLTQASIIQQRCQRLILALTASTNYNLYFQDISQAYVQLTTLLNCKFFCRSPSKLGLNRNSFFYIIKLLYKVYEVGAHWYNTYYKHHLEKISIS